jgi:hypothetical protein
MSVEELYTIRTTSPRNTINMGIVGGAVNIKGNLKVANNMTIGSNLTVTNNISSSANITTSGNGLGFSSGGNVTQTVSKSGAVSLNKPTGRITMNAAILNAATIVSFVLTNSVIAANDHVIVSHISGGTLGAYGVTASAAVGNSTVYIRNNSASNLSEALVLRFTVFKSANS